MLKRISVFQKAIAHYLSEWLHIFIMMYYIVQSLYMLQRKQIEWSILLLQTKVWKLILFSKLLSKQLMQSKLL